jgi:hypothetical protein
MEIRVEPWVEDRDSARVEKVMVMKEGLAK